MNNEMSSKKEKTKAKDVIRMMAKIYKRHQNIRNGQLEDGSEG
jgi:hypothetical protein